MPRQFAAAPHNPRKASIIDDQVMFGAAFADEIQAQPSISYEFDVTVAQRRQAETAIVTCVFDIADACLRRVAQRCDHRPPFGLRQAIRSEEQTSELKSP